jgi:hypothetical protein
MLTGAMNLHDLSVSQLKRAAEIKGRIEALTKELNRISGASATSGATATKKQGMSASVRRKIAAAQKARWAKVQGAKTSARVAASGAKTKKKQVSRATRAKLRAKLKAFWAAKKAGKK